MSDYKIKVGFELDNDLKEQIDKYINDTAFKLGLNYKFEKMELDEDDTLIIRIPTDEYGDILVDYEEVQEYYNAVKDNVNCKNIVALPDVLTFKILDDELLELIVKDLNEELNRRKKMEFNKSKEDSPYSLVTYGDNYAWSEVHKYGESSKVMYAPEGLIFNTGKKYVFEKELTVAERFKQLENHISALQNKIDMLMSK